MKPGVWKKRVSTCEFAQPRANGHGQSISRFTVISTEPGQAASYEAFQEGQQSQSRDFQSSQSKTSVHRHHHTASGSRTGRLRSGSGARRSRAASRNSATGRLQSSRGSLSSLHSSRQSTPHTRNVRHKRGVDFSHVRKRSNSTTRARGDSLPPYITEQGSTYQLESTNSDIPEVPSLPGSILTKRASKRDSRAQIQQALESNARPAIRSRHASEIFKEELRHFSSNIARDCDEAFKSSLIEEDSIAGSLTEPDGNYYESTPFSYTIEDMGEPVLPDDSPVKSYSSRPLPPLPSSPSNGTEVSPLAPTPMESRPTTGDSYFEELRLDQVKTAQPVVLIKHPERRVVSAPVYHHRHKSPVGLPPINETGVNNDKARIVSAPPHTPTRSRGDKNRGIEYLSRVENSIRVVYSPGNESPVKVPEPLNVRKKVSETEMGRITSLSRPEQMALRPVPAAETEQKGTQETAPQVPDRYSTDAQAEVKKKKSSWFRRVSKIDSDHSRKSMDWQDCSSYATSSEGKRSDSASTEVATKKKPFSFSFWKSNKTTDSSMSIDSKWFPRQRDMLPSLTTADDPNAKQRVHANDRASIKPIQETKTSHSDWRESDSGGIRNIEVKQNWLARLFRVKPATSHLCMTVSRRRARQEIAILLREWRKYGIRGIQVDKQRNIVFARVAAKNCK